MYLMYLEIYITMITDLIVFKYKLTIKFMVTAKLEFYRIYT